MIGRRAMSFRSGRNRDEPEINFIPLIDLLLVILIFLMVTTTFSKFTELQVNLPSAEADSTASRPVEIVVAVAADGRYLINTGDQARMLAPEALGTELARIAADQREPLLVIHADAGARHQSVVAVLEAARQAGIARVSFAAQSSAAGAGAR